MITKKVSRKLILLVVGLLAAGNSVRADFVNGGFEAGNLTGWTLNSGVWYSDGSQTVNDSYQSDSSIISNSAATDPNSGGNLREVLQGANSFRLNNQANGAHFSTLSQTVTDYTSADMYLGFAAVLENPTNPHTEEQTPKFNFSIFDVTKNETLYAVQFDSRNAVSQGITWNTGVTTGNNSTWMYSDWNIIHVDTSLLQGDTFEITVSAYDCALGGHGGYAYVDSFSPIMPVANPGVTTNFIEASSLSETPEPSQVATSTMVVLCIGGFIIRRRIRK